MKTISFILLTLLSAISFAQALEDAREIKIVQMEYSEPSQQGHVRIANCKHCEYQLYNFKSNIIVHKNNRTSTLEALLSEYWDAGLTTIFIKPGTNELLRISYFN